MTATKTTSTKTNEDQTPVVDVDVVSSEATPESETPEVKDEAQSPEVKPEPKAEPAKGKAVVKATRELETVRFAQQRELTESYSDFGFLYHGHSPVANSIGLELGVVTKDEKTKQVQRTGFGFYLRSDHLADASFDSSDF